MFLTLLVYLLFFLASCVKDDFIKSQYFSASSVYSQSYTFSCKYHTGHLPLVLICSGIIVIH